MTNIQKRDLDKLNRLHPNPPLKIIRVSNASRKIITGNATSLTSNGWVFIGWGMV